MSEVVLTFFCPVTKGRVEWDVPHDAKELTRQWSTVVRLACDHCKGEHSFSFREAYVEAMVDRIEKDLACESEEPGNIS
jgi:hypothetical protein